MEIAIVVTNGLVAVGTLVLAWKTASLAKVTRSVAIASGDETRISAEAFRARIRPWLTRVEEAQTASVMVSSSDHVSVSLRMRNVGPGLALIPPDACRLIGHAADGSTAERTTNPTQPVVGRGDTFWVAFVVAGPDIDADTFLNRHSYDDRDPAPKAIQPVAKPSREETQFA